MSVAEQVDQFFKSTGQRVFIEVEAKTNKVQQFIEEYNAQYSQNLGITDDGVISLDDDANKWGLELRCYFSDSTGMPSGITVTRTKGYRNNYPFRFNDVAVIRELFSLGYKIGLN